jgi:hypothetical protein
MKYCISSTGNKWNNSFCYTHFLFRVPKGTCRDLSRGWQRHYRIAILAPLQGLPREYAAVASCSIYKLSRKSVSDMKEQNQRVSCSISNCRHRMIYMPTMTGCVPFPSINDLNFVVVN